MIAHLATRRTPHTSYLGIAASRQKPTRNHRPAIWECMLGTVYAMNASGEVRYFDYDHAGAQAFAGVSDAADIRLHRADGRTAWCDDAAMNPRNGKMVLWIERHSQRTAPDAERKECHDTR